MINEITDLKNKFYEIKDMGWIKSDTDNSGGIGNTFERLMGIPSNEFEIPDFNQIEIKTKTQYSESYTSLFNCTPTGPHYHEVERIKDEYGYPDSKLREYKVLNTCIGAKQKNNVGLKFLFELKVDKQKKKLYLLVYNKKGILIEKEVYWDFDILEEKLYRKLKYLAYVKALKKKINGQKFFKYYEMKIYKLKDFDTFINLIDDGIIKISMKIGIYRDNKRKGKIHDHGTSFCIQEEKLNMLYDLISIYK